MNQISISFNKMEKKVNQIAAVLQRQFENGSISPGDQLPSINSFSMYHKVARDTVEKAYNLLKKQGLIVSVPGKGYFVVKNKMPGSTQLIAVFDINKQESVSYNKLIQHLKNTANIHIQLYDYEANRLNELIQNGNRIL